MTNLMLMYLTQEDLLDSLPWKTNTYHDIMTFISILCKNNIITNTCFPECYVVYEYIYIYMYIYLHRASKK